MEQWINLYRASHVLEAHAIKGALEVSGIRVRLNGDGLQSLIGELPVDLLQVTLMVPEHQQHQAARVIERYQQRQGNGWLCGRCGEENGANFDICWHCGNDPQEE
ncbi:putative signal transducing protein [Aeromonas simiae]|uniref:DUF2007 domain-containing protein n=1 Tax=Aeromonas simiae TaxID=218936 RepID=A0A5J6WYD0_9GAMM|nr:DUF2007 domain-containing protein [Aeromonas simiae]MDO2949034.1 DUF2007 domain-containing protein [Aeromonas simiae]MDO2952521.1 DUF2007 domain-containing protein [Aeromonas simiae]MDO2957339.1 DUF2007 domain-containing protein [Aeromonas simiae]QFI56229.1 DUF2007 domain-containing protein [Aeromonas simiae]